MSGGTRELPWLIRESAFPAFIADLFRMNPRHAAAYVRRHGVPAAITYAGVRYVTGEELDAFLQRVRAAVLNGDER